MTTEKKARKPRTVDPDERLALVDAEIARFERLIGERIDLLEKTEALAQERRDALAKTQAKLNALQAKRERIISLKERRAKKATGVSKRSVQQAELAEMAEFKRMLAEKGMTLDDVKNIIR